MFHIGGLKVRVDSIHVLDRKTDHWISGKRIVERGGINARYGLKRWVGADDTLPWIKRHLIVVETVSGSDRSRAFLKWVPGDSHTWREVIASWRNGLAKRRNCRTCHGRLAVNYDPVQWVTRSGDPRTGTAENLKGLAGTELRRNEV